MKSEDKSPIVFAIIFYWLLVLVLFSTSLILTKGHFGYPQDDTYIHMAIGKHFAQDGFWGVSQLGFSSSTSSPFWTFLIALSYKLFGVNDYTPIIFSLIAGNLVIVYCYSILKNDLNIFRLNIFLAAIILLTPLSMLALSGMEHLLHGFLTICLLFTGANFLRSQESAPRSISYLSFLAGLIAMVRYEGLFLIFAICLVLLYQKRFVPALIIGTSGLLPIMLYGIFSMSKGWYFLPNSLILKGNTLATSSSGNILSFFQRLIDNVLLAPHILILALVCWRVYAWKKRSELSSGKDQQLFILFIIMLLLHMIFAKVGWFYRYDAYLMLTGILILAKTGDPILNQLNGRLKELSLIKTTSIISISVLLALPFAIRASLSHSEYPVAIKNIYEQQYQMALFIKEYYSGSVIALNDIGAVNYLAETRTIDLYGLASLEVAELRRNKAYDAAAIRNMVLKNNVEIVIIYNSWFDGNLPPEWQEIGRWEITNDVATADEVVSFYTPNINFKMNAIANLKSFSKQLPEDVIQSGIYTTP